MNTYPEMDAKIVGILRLGEEPAHLYAAQRIEELEGALDEARRANERLAGAIEAFIAAVGHTVIMDGPVEAAWNALVAAAPSPASEDAGGTISRQMEGLHAIDVEVREAERCRDAGDWGQVGAMLHEVRRVLDNTLAGKRHPWAEFADDVAVPPASEDAGGAG